MALPKTKAWLVNGCLLIGLLLCGCGGQSLSEREIVRGVLFTRQGTQFSACLVLADQNAKSESDGNKISAAQGKTPAQALERAEQSLYGEVYYGLLDLVAFPSDTDLATAREIGALLYDNAQPAPELSVFILNTVPKSWAEEGSTLYLNMKASEKIYKVHCGLQQLFSQKNVCAVPGYRPGGGYDFLLLAENEPAIRYTGVAEAQLAAVLCGQTSVLNGTFAFGKAACEAKAYIIADGNEIQLHLRDVTLTALDSSVEPSSLKSLLQQELQTGFADLQRQMQQAGADPFHFRFWQACLYGPESAFQSSVLKVLID